MKNLRYIHFNSNYTSVKHSIPPRSPTVSLEGLSAWVLVRWEPSCIPSPISSCPTHSLLFCQWFPFMLHWEVRSDQGNLSILQQPKDHTDLHVQSGVLSCFPLFTVGIVFLFFSKLTPAPCSRLHPLPFHQSVFVFCAASFLSAFKHVSISLIIKSTNTKTETFPWPHKFWMWVHFPLPFYINFSKGLFTHADYTL